MALSTPLTKLKFHAALLQQLSDLLNNGLSLEEGLRFLEQVYPQRTAFFKQLQNDLNSGLSFDNCLRRQQFPAIICAQLHFSKTHWQFKQTMHDCATALNYQIKQTLLLRRLMLYPLVLLAVIAFVIILLQTFIVPQIELLFIQSDASTPLLLKLLKNAHYGLIGIGLISSGLFVFIKRWLTHKSAYQQALFWSQFRLTTRIAKLYYTQLFAREFSLLLKSGLSLQQILQLSQSNHTGLFKDVAIELNSELQNGLTFSSALQNHPFFLPLFVTIVQHGERSGKLPQELLACHHYCNDLLKDILKRLLHLIQPLLLLLIGTFIIMIYLSIMLPLFESINYL